MSVFLFRLAGHSRPVSDLSLTNNYYDESELLSAQSPHLLSPVATMDLVSQRSNDGLYSRVDSLYEAIDNRLQQHRPPTGLPDSLDPIVSAP